MVATAAPAEPSFAPYTRSTPTAPPDLTSRELEVLRSLTQGVTSTQIDERLVGRAHGMCIIHAALRREDARSRAKVGSRYEEAEMGAVEEFLAETMPRLEGNGQCTAQRQPRVALLAARDLQIEPSSPLSYHFQK